MSDQLEDLCCKMEKKMDSIRRAMQEDADPGIFKLLAEAQEEILREIQRSDIGNDRCLLKRMEMLNHQVFEMMVEIQRYQKEISLRIKRLSDRKKMVRAYIT